MTDNLTRDALSEKFPGNTKTKKTVEEPAEEKRVQKVVTGKVKKQKKGLGKKVAETFLEDDSKSVASYVFFDILIPAAKELISDMVSGGVEMFLFGEKRGRSASRNTTRQGSRSYTSYGNYYKQNDRDERDRRRDRDISRPSRSMHNFDEIILETRGEAEDVLAHLVDLTIDYDQATVADFYDLVGVTSEYTDRRYGWTDLRDASISRVRGGYLINLPRTRPLD